MNFIKGLQLVFIVLKLCGVIDWSWLWVTAPFWGLALFTLIFGKTEVIVNWIEEEEEEDNR